MRQERITENRIGQMVGLKPRRWRLKDGWNALNEPSSSGKDWSLTFPFRETFENLCQHTCPARHGGVRCGSDERPYAYLKCDAHDRDEVLQWLARIGDYVALRDCLSLSFALDYERTNGDPHQPQTEIGALRAKVKIDHNDGAVAEIVPRLVKFCRSMPGYDRAEVVVSVPPSRRSPPFDFPRSLAEGVARELAIPYVAALRTVKDRPKLAGLPLAAKLEALRDTVSLDPCEDVTQKNVLLVDDVYQSGITMNYNGMQLLEAGARAIFGLALEKTCRNDDNVSGQQS